MDANYNSFDRLVAGLSSIERVSLLRKLESDISADKESLVFESPEANLPESDLEKEFQNESVLLRFWIFLRGLFSNMGIQGAYNEYRINLVLRKINNENPNLIDTRHLTLENIFYEYLLKLQSAALFFKNGIQIYEKDEGGFYNFLTMLVMPDFAEHMEKEVSPYSIPFSSEVTPELRTSLIRKMEETLAGITSAEKSKLRDCFSCLEWFKQFVSLPFSHFAALFKNTPDKGMCCSMKSAQTEIERFAKVLCNAKKIVPEVLEALYMFAAEEKMIEGYAVDIEDGLPAFSQKSMQHISFIKYFICSVPICAIGAVASNSALWIPEYKDVSDNWFLKCKNQWRKVFDEKWLRWLHDRKILKTKEDVAALFEISDYPFIPNQPWKKGNLDLVCRREYSLGFLYSFLSNIYPGFKPFLEIVIVSGKFILPENRLEFTDSYNEMNQLAGLLSAFNAKLAPQGIYGQAFTAIGDKHGLQVQEKARNLMRSIESEINLFVTVFSGCCRSFKQLFDGMFVDIRNIKYDSLSNLASLTDSKNVPVRSKLLEISDKLSNAFQLLKEVESLETEVS